MAQLQAQQAERKETTDNLRTAEGLLFANIFQAYLECSDEIQEGVREMVSIINNPNADEQEKAMSLDSLVEALFPTYHNDGLGIDLADLGDLEAEHNPSVAKEVEAEEATFAERLRNTMDEKGVTQESLATAIGVGQSAIAMMLSRDCRPQRRTVLKLAEALKVQPEELWPEIKVD